MPETILSALDHRAIFLFTTNGVWSRAITARERRTVGAGGSNIQHRGMAVVMANVRRATQPRANGRRHIGGRGMEIALSYGSWNERGTEGSTDIRRECEVDREDRRIFGAEGGWGSGDTDAVARVDATDGCDRD